MASLMEGNGALLLGRHHLGLLLQSADDSVHCIEEVLPANSLSLPSCSDESRLIANVGDVCAREARSLAGEEVDIHRVIHFDGFQVDDENLLSLIEVRQVNMNLPIETSGTQQGGVEHIGTVGGSHDDDTAVGAESIHFGKQCVERVLPLIVAAHGGILRPGSSHSVNLIDEDDTRSFLLCLTEQVPDAAGAHANEHFDKVAATHGEERHSRLSSHSLGQQSLTSSRRSHQKGSLGYLATQISIPLRILEEVDDFLHLFLGTHLSCHIAEGDTQVVAFLIHLRLALAHVEDTA